VLAGFLHPVVLDEFRIDPVSVEVSIHASVKIYLAINQTNLNFSAFVRRNVRCLSLKLGEEVSKHYFYGAVMRAGEFHFTVLQLNAAFMNRYPLPWTLDMKMVHSPSLPF
jgi:hypothetical protein